MSRIRADYVDCLNCGAAMLTADWDDMSGVYVTQMRADPTPLTRLDETTCVVIGRPTYLLERTISRTLRLSARWSGNMQRTSPYAIAILPSHRCGARFPATLDEPAVTPRNLPTF